MDDLKDQLEDFNELHSLGIEILTQLEDAVKFGESERDKAKDDLTNKNLSAELAKCQREVEVVKRERDNLRGKFDELFREKDKILNELGRYQEAFSRASRERDELRGKFDELKKILVR